jgi:hypothetical protein
MTLTLQEEVIRNIYERATAERRSALSSAELDSLRQVGLTPELIQEFTSILFQERTERENRELFEGIEAEQVRVANLEAQAEVDETNLREANLQTEVARLDIPFLARTFGVDDLDASLLPTLAQEAIEASRAAVDPVAQQQVVTQIFDAATADRRSALTAEELGLLRQMGVTPEMVQELVQALFQQRIDRENRELFEGIAQRQRETEQRQRAAIEGLPPRLQNQTGITALTALGSFPDTEQAALGDSISPSLLQSIGFALPQGASAGAGLQPRQFFSGGLPTVSQLQNFNQQELGLLSGIVSLGGAGEPFDLRQRAAGVTPLPAGTVTGAAGGLPDIAPQARPRTRRI